MKKIWNYIQRLSAPMERRIYLDYAAATPLLPEVLERIHMLQQTLYGNPSAIHREGVAAKKVLEESRTTLARVLEVKESEIIFTASGTEANNLAISGYIKKLIAQGREPSTIEIVTTLIEHPSILEVIREWEGMGVRVVYVPVDEYGRVHSDALEACLSPQTVLVSIGYANSEIGTVQALRRLARVIDQFSKKNGTTITFHTDASQAPLWLPCQLSTLGVDMMTLDTGKCNGPKGLGVLVVKTDTHLTSVVHGGGQERGLRAGTENVPLISGGVLALAIAQANWQTRSTAVQALAKELRTRLKAAIPAVVFNGPDIMSEPLERLPHNVHISLPGIDTEFAVVVLDSKGVACSTKSACSGAGGGESTVVRTISSDTTRALSTIRFTIDPASQMSDMAYVAQVLADHTVQMSLVDRKPN